MPCPSERKEKGYFRVKFKSGGPATQKKGDDAFTRKRGLFLEVSNGRFPFCVKKLRVPQWIVSTMPEKS